MRVREVKIDGVESLFLCSSHRRCARGNSIYRYYTCLYKPMCDFPLELVSIVTACFAVGHSLKKQTYWQPDKSLSVQAPRLLVSRNCAHRPLFK